MSIRYVWAKYDNDSKMTWWYDEAWDGKSVSSINISQLDCSKLYYGGSWSQGPLGFSMYDSVGYLRPGQTVSCADIVPGDSVESISYSPGHSTITKPNSYWSFRARSGTRWTLDNSNNLKRAGGEKFSVSKITRGYKDYQGDRIGTVSAATSNAYKTGSKQGNYWYEYLGSDNIDPKSISYPSEFKPGMGLEITIAPSTSVTYTDGNTIEYTIEAKINNGNWTVVGSAITATKWNYIVPLNCKTLQLRVKSNDKWGFTSTTYKTGKEISYNPIDTTGLHQRLHRKNASGTYDTIYLETLVSYVYLSNGSDVETMLNDIIQRLENLES